MDMQATDTGLAGSQSQKSQPKTLKFVTNYGQPQVKRRRIGAACGTCRKRKTACSGERPTCDTCKQNRLDCAGYNPDTPMPASTGHKRTASGSGHVEVKNGNQGKAPQQQRVKKEVLVDPDLGGFATSSNTAVHPGLQSQWSTESANVLGQQPPPATIDSMRNGHAGDSLFSGPRNRMPYFRWLGPTAIMPGFKQMVVKVRRQDTDMSRSSTNGDPSSTNEASNPRGPNMARVASMYSNTPVAMESDIRTPLHLPFYDTSPMPPSELITHLAQTFFTHLGCNYPFLQRERFMRDLEEKQVDAILVDAVCALAARFSTHDLLTQQASDNNKSTPAEHGHAFAQRAKTALPDTYSCPSVAAVQAALLLAYLEFGESRDSGLWMYLGISIRMAQDLGMHKLEGLSYKGKTGPTPKMIKRESIASPTLSAREKNAFGNAQPDTSASTRTPMQVIEIEEVESEKEKQEQEAVEQERVDTFWAVFLLDRGVSSGTGRRSTLRDKDIEISFPVLDEPDVKTGWPAPFPALIRIVHLYGRVADLLNSIKEPSDITTDTPKRLASMESQVTSFYQGLSSKLHFDAVNFQHYMKAGEGTNFVMLHFWFHLLIVLLHQPTLLKTFAGRMLQLFPNSHQLSMSSAKTIADILSYSQLMDAKASLGNPFTAQPIYIAACAFLRETAEQTATSTAQSRASSPSSGAKRKDESRPPSSTATGVKRMSISELAHPVRPDSSSQSKTPSDPQSSSTTTPAPRLPVSKHTLLATAATQHYQLCYKALQSLETYWAGTKYILTVLDQKFEGVGDPLLYTAEEGESAMERPRPEARFTSPGWRRKGSWGRGAQDMVEGGADEGGAFGGGPGGAIGWTLTGTMNSPSTNLAWHYPGGAHAGGTLGGSSAANHYDPGLAGGVSSGATQQERRVDRPGFLTGTIGTATVNGNLPTTTAPNLPLANNNHHATSFYHHSNTALPAYPASNIQQQTDPLLDHTGTNLNYNMFNPWDAGGDASFGDMMIESQDVEMSCLGLDAMPWFDSSWGMWDSVGVGDAASREAG